jgi:hypothetical protein
MGKIQRSKTEQALGVGRELSTSAGDLVVFGSVGEPTRGNSSTMIFKVRGTSIIRYNIKGEVTTTRPASLEEGFMYTALQKALARLGYSTEEEVTA